MKPVISIIIMIFSLFVIVFVQMEERRIGYDVLVLNRAQRRVLEEKRVLALQLARLMKPQNVERLAQSRLTMKKVQSNQIIHLTGSTN